ncbi:MAG: GIY-YIG nuclease family protein [Verrucomicrobiota bacterium]
MDPVVNPSLPFLHRLGKGKMLLLQILYENGAPMWRRKLSDSIQLRATAETTEKITRENLVQAVRSWLEDLERRSFVENLTYGYWNLTEQGRAFAASLGSSSEKLKEGVSLESALSTRDKQVSVPFTPQTIEDILISLLSGRTVKRIDLVDPVIAEHLQRGGVIPSTNVLATIKKGLSNLQRKGLAHAVAGHWTAAGRINNQVSETPIHQTMVTDSQETKTPSSTNVPRTEVPATFKSEARDLQKESLDRKVIGTGNEKVYVYYFENDRRAALADGKSTWDVKVGKTSGDVDARVRGQGASTARARPPNITLEIRTENADLLESALHTILKFCGLHIRKDGGSEWFDANPSFVESIYLHLKALETVLINRIH